MAILSDYKPYDPFYSERPQGYSPHWARPLLDPKPPAPLWTAEETTAARPMKAEQAATLKELAEVAYEREAFQSNLTRGEADLRIAMLTAKLKLLDGPPYALRPQTQQSAPGEPTQKSV